MLVISQMPYLKAAGSVGRGILLVPLTMAGDGVIAPTTHTAHWIGDIPCEADGTDLRGVNITGTTSVMLPGTRAARMICCKPRAREFHDYVEFVATYEALLGSPIGATDAGATARVRSRPSVIGTRSGPFAYVDTATPRAALGPVMDTVRGQTIGIIGLGGTGSYVLDLVSKCPVDSIHLFDDDVFEQHSAFRAPGAATVDDLRARRRKVDHFASVYAGMHRRIVPHAVRVEARTAPLLDVLDFAFVCIDDAASKPPIMDRLEARGIDYVDVGMGLHGSDHGIVGAVRTTLVASGDCSMLDRIPVVGDPEGVYSTNIQICELNALNAALAVIAWKRHRGFYHGNGSRGGSSNSVYVVDGGHIHKEERA